MVTIPPDLRSVVDHDGAVILDISRNAMTTVNSTGAYIWKRLERGLSPEAIISELTQDTGAEASVVASDVHQFIEDLKSKHLLAG